MGEDTTGWLRGEEKGGGKLFSTATLRGGGRGEETRLRGKMRSRGRSRGGRLRGLGGDGHRGLRWHRER